MWIEACLVVVAYISNSLATSRTVKVWRLIVHAQSRKKLLMTERKWTAAYTAVSAEALVFIVIGRSCSEACEFDSHYWPGSFLRFNFRPIVSSSYCASEIRGVQLLLVLKLWPIVETSVMSENDGTTVRQTAHTMQLWPHELGAPCGSRLSRRKAQYSVMCLSLAAAIVVLAQTTQ